MGNQAFNNYVNQQRNQTQNSGYQRPVAPAPQGYQNAVPQNVPQTQGYQPLPQNQQFSQNMPNAQRAPQPPMQAQAPQGYQNAMPPVQRQPQQSYQPAPQPQRQYAQAGYAPQGAAPAPMSNQYPQQGTIPAPSPFAQNSTAPRAFGSGGSSGSRGRGRRADLSQYLMRKFKELDQYDLSWVDQIKKELKNLGKIAAFEAFGVIWLRFPYDPSLAFSDYLKKQYKAAWYKKAKLWAVEPELINSVYADMEMALKNQLRLQDGTTYGFPPPQPRNYDNGGYNRSYGGAPQAPQGYQSLPQTQPQYPAQGYQSYTGYR